MGNESSKSKEQYINGPCMEVVFVMAIIMLILQFVSISSYGTYGCIHKDKAVNEELTKECQDFLGINILSIIITFAFCLYIGYFIYEKFLGNFKVNSPSTKFEYFMFIFIIILLGLYATNTVGGDHNMDQGPSSYKNPDGSFNPAYYNAIKNSEYEINNQKLIGTQSSSAGLMFICLILVAVYVKYKNELYR